MNDERVAAKGQSPAEWPEEVSFVFGQAPLVMSTLTLSSKVQTNAYNHLNHAAREVNQVWNFCNATSYRAWYGRYGGKAKWLSAFEMNSLLAGCGEIFNKIGIDIAQAVAAEHAIRRSQYKTSKLKFRKSGGSRRTLGWIPFKPNNLRFTLLNEQGKRVRLTNDPQPIVPAWTAKPDRYNALSKEEKSAYQQLKAEFATTRARAEAELLAWEYRHVQAASTIKVSFMGKTIRLHNAQRLLQAYRLAKQGVGTLRSGNFSQDSCGDWYLNVVIDKAEAQLIPLRGKDSSVGLDPGQKNAMTGSDGEILRSRRFRESEQRIAQAQRRAHKRQAKREARKVKRQRLDDRNKFCRQLINEYAKLWVGNLSPRKLKKSKLKGQAKSISDSAIGAVTTTLKAMGHRAGRVVEKVDEAYSTRMCSSCQSLTGPAGLDACDVRQWTCAACGTLHDRDINSAVILRQRGEWLWNTQPSRFFDHTAEPRFWLPFAGTR